MSLKENEKSLLSGSFYALIKFFVQTLYIVSHIHLRSLYTLELVNDLL